MTAERRYRASDRALLTELGDGTGVLLDLDSKFYFTLNETAIAVWKLLGAPEAQSRDELAARLTREFEVADEQARSDLDAVLDVLSRERLVTVSADAP
jgi:hypothetical protein